MKETRLDYTNIYNRPLYFGIFIAIVEFIVTLIVTISLISRPFDLANTGFFIGAAFFSDMMNIFWGYVVLTVIIIVGIVQFYLGYNGIQSDHPLIGKIVSFSSFIPIAVSLSLEFYYSYCIIKAYNDFLIR